MPLQNRVTPFGEIVAVSARGDFIGNRGVIHDPATKTITKPWAIKGWIVCALTFNGRHRELMSAGSWTELFFLDEATALAAGHRPCFQCRHAAAKAFRHAFSQEPLKASEMDLILHAERLDGKGKRLHPIEGDWRDLPDGAMVTARGQAFLVKGGEALPWSPAGYEPAQPLSGEVLGLTPPSTIGALRAGYSPQLHASAGP